MSVQTVDGVRKHFVVTIYEAGKNLNVPVVRYICVGVHFNRQLRLKKRDNLFSKQNYSLSNALKKKTWKKIASKVNAVIAIGDIKSTDNIKIIGYA